MSNELLLTFNAGSSTVKIGLFSREGHIARRIGKGMIDFRSKPLTFHLVEGPEVFDVPLDTDDRHQLTEILEEALLWLARHFNMGTAAVAAHRVVHGGDDFTGAVMIDDASLAAIEALTPLAPLHQPTAVKLIRAIRDLRPDMRQTASFDTAFHRSQTDLVRRFAIPRDLHDSGIKRYGFHGLSYKYIAGALQRPIAGLVGDRGLARVVVAHLGSGASLCALENGLSRDTSMGFSTLDGIPMATRCGALDPGVLLHLLNERKLAPAAVEDIVYHRSGLLGMSGISADSRVLLASDKPEAAEAMDIFAFRIAGEIARLATTLGGLDAVVFTAGIGEHQPELRRMVADRLRWLGLALDDDANAANAPLISAPSSAVAALVIPTDEEQVIADEAMEVLAQTAVLAGV